MNVLAGRSAAQLFVLGVIAGYRWAKSLNT